MAQGTNDVQLHDIGLNATLAGGTVEGDRTMSVHALNGRSPRVLIMVGKLCELQ